MPRMPRNTHRVVPWSLCVWTLCAMTSSALAEERLVTDFTDDLRRPAAGSLRAVLAEAAPGDVVRFDRPLLVPLAGPLVLATPGITVVGPGGVQRPAGARKIPQIRIQADDVTLENLEVRDVTVSAAPKRADTLAGPTFTDSRFFGQARITLRNCVGARLADCSILSDPVDSRRSRPAVDDFSSRDTRIESGEIRIVGGTALSAQLVHGMVVQDVTLTGNVRIRPGVAPKRPAPYSGDPGMLTFDGNTVDGTVVVLRAGLQTGALHVHDNTARRLAVTGGAPDVQNNVLGHETDGPPSAFTVLSVDAARIAGDVRVIGNRTRGGTTGIEVRSSRGAPTCLVAGNQVEDASTIGMIVVPGGATVVRGNQITGGIVSGAGAGMSVGADTVAWPLSVEDNMVADTAGTGILVDSPHPGVTFTGNEVRDNGGYGINVQDKCRAEILGGVVERNGTSGDAEEPAGVIFGVRTVGSITATIVRNNVGDGIIQDPTAHVRITQVSCTGNSRLGIAVDSTHTKLKGRKGVQPEPPTGLAFDSAASSVTGTAEAGATVEVYRVEDGPRTGNPGQGEGATFLSSGVADGEGRFSIPVTCTDGDLLTLTATRTDSDGASTSAFSGDVACSGAAMELISVSSTGGLGDGHSALGTHATRAVSTDGRFVVFSSAASNLVPGDTNERSDVFLRDRTAGTTVRVSLRSDGSQIVPRTEFVETDGSSGGGSVSDDGRYVAFVAYADLVVPQDTGNLENHVYLHDVVAGTTVAVSGPADHAAGFDSSISADGRWVAFVSADPDWDATDGNGTTDVFVWDRVGGGVSLVSRTTAGVPSGESFNAATQSPRLSADGRHVAFCTALTLTPGDTVAGLKVFVRDRQLGTTELVSRTEGGLPATGSLPSISGDGRFVAFATAEALVAEDINGLSDVYLRDRTLGTVVLVSRDAEGGLLQGGSFANSVSDDGRLVAFVGPGGHTDDGFTVLFSDVYVRDLVAGVTMEAAAGRSGDFGDADGPGEAPCMSGDGRLVAFVSVASNLVDIEDVLFLRDVFARTLPAPVPAMAGSR